MLKKKISLILLLIFALFLAACGGDDKDTNQASDHTASDSETEEVADEGLWGEIKAAGNYCSYIWNFNCCIIL